MKQGWMFRLVEAVEADPRSTRELSRAIGAGDNFVQQMIKNDKEPSVSKLEALLTALGPSAAIYVRTGLRVGEADEPFIEAALAVPPHLRASVRRMLLDIAASAPGPAPAAGDPAAPTEDKD